MFGAGVVFTMCLQLEEENKEEKVTVKKMLAKHRVCDLEQQYASIHQFSSTPGPMLELVHLGLLVEAAISDTATS